MMINIDDVTGEDKKEQSPHWLQISDHPYKMLIVAGSRSKKANVLGILVYVASNSRPSQLLFSPHIWCPAPSTLPYFNNGLEMLLTYY